MTMAEFCAAIQDDAKGVAALCDAPFDYRSRVVPSGFEFTILDGPLRGRRGIAPEFFDAVRRAVLEAPAALRGPVPEETKE